MEWLSICWHQSCSSTCSVPVITLPSARSRETRLLAGQLPIAAQASLYVGALPPIMPS